MRGSQDVHNQADKKDINDAAVSKVVEKINEALRKNDLSMWMSLFYSEDDIAYEAQKIWFEKYMIEIKPDNYNFVVLDISTNRANAVLRCRIEIEYSNFNPLHETHIYTVEYVEARRDFCITWLEKLREPFMAGDKDSSHWFDFMNNIDCTASYSNDWWKNNTLIEAAYEANDPDSPLIYARAITRNIRFREAHPILECASILACMMSAKLAWLAADIFDCDQLKYMGNVYNVTKDTVLVRLVRDDRDNTWTSKFLAPWYGFDEMLLFRDDKGLISCNCSSYMSFLAALLRIGGYAGKDVIQIRTGNQDALIISVGESNYLISSGKIEKLTEKSLYILKKISKLFSDCYFWTEQGLTNIHRDKIVFYKNLIASRTPIFDFSWKLNDKYVGTFDMDSVKLPDLISNKNPDSLNKDIRRNVFELSKEYPGSVFTWAKYASQTLYVSKPETYLSWSIQSPAVRDKIAVWNSLDEILEEIKELLNISIFSESDRIMTADQVLRHKRCDDKAKALLIFCWFKLKKGAKTFVLFSDRSVYCAYKTETEWIYLDAKSGRKAVPEGDILLALNDKRSVYPLLNGDDFKKFKSMNQIEEVFE
ncbi:hypothetical protein [Acetivibrio mesophilus]|uniref:Uncharacterized protein n=1 Tax=Acetivibrio mesophilus TaxID=2487273 RepID=A0A4V1K2L5_9FIRM|nr:hypothetical protein [Acetivibrio mesophilus]ODM26238.1 hypothetical protein A7W90_08375 [Clostridium sp. Bc-iso-3]RXE60709.1 hypothetical protein EFD62_01965 [Acetivibrio mesophilus]HHV28122.1 hypothetical protein [Clostridium sp.]